MDDNDVNHQADNPECYEANSSSKPCKMFHKELAQMMYGFGDDRNPYWNTVDLIHDLVIKFIIDHILRADQFQLIMSNSSNQNNRHGSDLMSSSTNTRRLNIEHIMWAIRHDPKKYRRVCELIQMNMHLKEARKAFDEGTMNHQANQQSNYHH